MKECFKCKEIKDIDDFYKHPKMSDGHINKCKECTKKDVKKNYFKNREAYIEYDRQREQTLHRKKLKIKYQKQTRKNNPQKYKCTTMVNHAIKKGKIKKGLCEVCNNEKVEAHHEDYDKPFDINWLCKKHHLKLHNKIYIEKVKL